MAVINPTIVVTWIPKNKPEIPPFYCASAIVDVVPGMNLRIKGAGFNPEEKVELNICGEWKLGNAVVNKCGAFQVTVTIPNAPALLALGVVSVKARVGQEYVAAWPLNVLKELPKPPKA